MKRSARRSRCWSTAARACRAASTSSSRPRPRSHDYMRPLDRMVVAPFSKTVLSTTGPTADRRTIIDAIKAIRPAGGTAILDAVAEAARSVGAPETRRAIVLITDGYDEHSTTSFEDALAAAKQARVTVYVTGDRRRRRHLDEGRAGAAEAGEGNRRPVLPAGERRPAGNGPQRSCRRCPESIPADLHAKQPDDRWQLAEHRRQLRRSALRGQDSDRVFRAEAGPHPAHD